MRPAWSVVLFTTLAGAGQGLFLALFAAELAGAAVEDLVLIGILVSFGLLAVGLVASFFHLGHPERAWRSAAMWRTSWLSREVIVLPAFMAVVLAWGTLHHMGFSGSVVSFVGLAGVALCLALFLCTGMIYACLRFLQEWHTPLTVINYALLGTASGLTLAAALDPAFVPAALAAGALAYLGRLSSLSRNARLRAKSSMASAIGVKHPKIAQIAQGAMGGSFNTREFFHGRPREVVRAVRWAFLVLVFPVPAALLLIAQDFPRAIPVAFVLQYAGLLAERWYFFAEARHPQNLYYQAIA